MLKVSVIQSEHPRLHQICQMRPWPLPFKRDLFKLRLPDVINHLLLCATAAETSTGEAIMSYSGEQRGDAAV